MTESEWMTSNDPAAMLREVVGREVGGVYDPSTRKVSDRKLRLFACACCKANGISDKEVARLEINPPYGPDSAWAGRWAEQSTRDVSQPVKSDILRHIVGNPWRPGLTKTCERCDGRVNCPDCSGSGWLSVSAPAWSIDVLRLAEALYAGEDCAYALHDALLEMGQGELAEHFLERSHPKGCWALDLIWGKE